MKRIILFFLVFIVSEIYGQNEFAATAFYTEFKKIYADAQAGFVNNKGDKRNTDFEELAIEYNIKLLLPLADSGKIVFPVSGNNPFVVYFFEPDKLRLKVDQRAVNLRDALLTVFDKPLYERTETSIINNHPFTNSWYFTNPEEIKSALAVFKMNIYFNEGKYYLSFEIRGKKEK
jgi:hypothetical protein